MLAANISVSAFTGCPSMQVIKERNFPYSSLKMLASARCVGSPLVQQPPERQRQRVPGHDAGKQTDTLLCCNGGAGWVWPLPATHRADLHLQQQLTRLRKVHVVLFTQRPWADNTNSTPKHM